MSSIRSPYKEVGMRGQQVTTSEKRHVTGKGIWSGKPGMARWGHHFPPTVGEQARNTFKTVCLRCHKPRYLVEDKPCRRTKSV